MSDLGTFKMKVKFEDATIANVRCNSLEDLDDTFKELKRKFGSKK